MAERASSLDAFVVRGASPWSPPLRRSAGVPRCIWCTRAGSPKGYVRDSEHEGRRLETLIKSEDGTW